MIIGITGTIGAGKGAVVDYLKTKGFAHYSVRDVLLEEVARRGLPPDRPSLRLVGNELRELYSPSYLVEHAYEDALARGGNAIIESIRAYGEVDFLKEKGAILLAVDADQRIRYERIFARGLSTDSVDFDTWLVHEEQELVSTQTHGQNLLGVMERADYRITNNGSLIELNEQIDIFLHSVRK